VYSSIYFGLAITSDQAQRAPAPKPTNLEVTSNVVDAGSVFQVDVPKGADNAGALFRRVVAWKSRDNLYPRDCDFLRLSQSDKLLPYEGPRSLQSWRKFWDSPEPGSVEGPVRYQGGNLVARLAEDPERLTPADFRLRPDSAGYRAGKDGKDIGADVDLVGPGPAYDRWKKTPDYQQWLKETGQVRAAVPKSEPDAFVLLASGQERKFATLAEAVLGSADGDTIEIRGNGPFLIDPIELPHALTIRAGAGFRPVISDSPQARLPEWGFLVVANAPLRVEGLEWRCTRPRFSTLFGKEDGPLSAANCRFVGTGDGYTCLGSLNACHLQNCELLAPSGAAVSAWFDSAGTFVVENCLLVGFNNLTDRDVSRGATVLFTHDTFVTGSAHLVFNHQLYAYQDAVRRADPASVRLVASHNVFGGDVYVYTLSGMKDSKSELPDLTDAEAEAWLPRRVELREERNLYRPGKPYLAIPERALGRGKDLADWNRFWGVKDTGSSEGIIRFRGGDLQAKSLADATKLTPEDFRLCPDSAGYRAGKDKKDLGADVDLVGPGPAYERWKKTPDYQQWLKETERIKK
jgi:hypothetical protein